MFMKNYAMVAAVVAALLVAMTLVVVIQRLPSRSAGGKDKQPVSSSIHRTNRTKLGLNKGVVEQVVTTPDSVETSVTVK